MFGKLAAMPIVIMSWLICSGQRNSALCHFAIAMQSFAFRRKSKRKNENALHLRDFSEVERFPRLQFDATVVAFNLQIAL